MATSTQSLSNTISPEVVGNIFVGQYYHFLQCYPEVVFKFYQDSSVLSRSDSNGFISSTTTMQAINEKILSMGYEDYKAEIKTADVQKSHGDGIIVLVTGSLSGKDNLKRNFTQTFFLAPQDNGYFVLNDIFRYLEDVEPLTTNSVNQTDDCSVQSALVSGRAKISFLFRSDITIDELL
uniref:NTF2 domain-containing protein n=1 Tax=Kalanchoe fedtschenkoi TaxID=63787 RepID=A0A7N0T9R1_KALFE